MQAVARVYSGSWRRAQRSAACVEKIYTSCTAQLAPGRIDGYRHLTGVDSCEVDHDPELETGVRAWNTSATCRVGIICAVILPALIY